MKIINIRANLMESKSRSWSQGGFCFLHYRHYMCSGAWSLNNFFSHIDGWGESKQGVQHHRGIGIIRPKNSKIVTWSPRMPMP